MPVQLTEQQIGQSPCIRDFMNAVQAGVSRDILQCPTDCRNRLASRDLSQTIQTGRFLNPTTEITPTEETIIGIADSRLGTACRRFGTQP